MGFLLMAAGSGVAQSPADQTPPTIRATTRLVEINVAVHDKKGAPVTGLIAEDFTILDGGKEEKIATFSVESRGTPQESYQPLPPNIFSNRIAREGGTPTNVAAILLDALETGFSDQAYARQQMIKFLSQLQPQDRVALYVLGRGGLHIVQDFTSNPSPLILAIRAHRLRIAAQAGGTTFGAGSSIMPTLGGPAALAAARLDEGLWAMSISRNISRQSLQVNVLNALQAIAQHLSGLPGRKSLLWITGSVPLPQTLDHFSLRNPGGTSNTIMSGRVRETIRLLSQADMALYPVDARGLYTDPDYNAENGGIPSQAGSALGGMGSQILAMNYYAQETGGRSYHDTNDLKAALRNALDDTELTYTLAYYPTHGKWNGEYRPIKVRVNREGVEVRCRKGYFAAAEEPPSKDTAAALKEAALNPLDATTVGLTVRARPLGGLGNTMEVVVNVDVKDLTFQPAQALRSVRFDTWLGQYTNSGARLKATSKNFSADLTEDAYQKVLKQGALSLTFHEKTKPRAEEVRVVVRDALSGSIGSVRIPLEELSTDSAHQAPTADGAPR
jgi:VWFA-related protein